MGATQRQRHISIGAVNRSISVQRTTPPHTARSVSPIPRTAKSKHPPAYVGSSPLSSQLEDTTWVGTRTFEGGGEQGGGKVGARWGKGR